MISKSRRNDIVEELSDIITGHHRVAGRPFIVGITGVDTAGKTQMSRELARVLEKEHKVQVIHVDHFHNEKSFRYNPELSEPEQYYRNSINFQRLVDEILDPLHKLGSINKTLVHLDLPTDTWTLQCSYVVTTDTIVIVEGVFLFRPEIQSYIDFFVYLHVPEAVIMERAHLRDVPRQGEDVLRKYERKYLPAQRDYIRKYRPYEHADVVVDNSDWQNPIIQYPHNFVE
jgi:uridine kinase